MVKLKGSSLLEVLIAMTIVVLSMVLSIRVMVNVTSSTKGWRFVSDSISARRMVAGHLIEESVRVSNTPGLLTESESMGNNVEVLIVKKEGDALYYTAKEYE